MQNLGEPVVEELLLDWLYSFLTVEEQDRLLGWHLGVSPKPGLGATSSWKAQPLLPCHRRCKGSRQLSGVNHSAVIKVMAPAKATQ